MPTKKQIYDFAVKWCNKFRDQQIDYVELVDRYLAEDCAELGFEMDTGKAFGQRYGSAVNDCDELDKIVDDITDIPLLGSAIYSRWRYFNHWAYDAKEILTPQNRAWFILALSRLANLTGENPFIFSGTLKKIRIVSNNICYGPRPQPDDEVEQCLTINSEGRIWFSRYIYGDGQEKHPKSRTQNFSINDEATKSIFNAMSAYFGNEYTEIFATDSGNWTMELTNTDDVTYTFKGSLCSAFEYNGEDLSDIIREGLGMDELYVFDGNNKPDKIRRICIDYHRITKIEPQAIPDDATWEYVTWDYTEQLVIDSKTESLELVQNIGTGCKISRKYEVQDGVESLLDDFDADYFFRNIQGNPDDVVETPNETKDYIITIDFEKSPQRIIKGTYDRNGLPDDFEEFAETVFDFIRFYGLGEILDPSVFGKQKRRRSDYIFCSVEFEDGYKTYYYLTDDESIKIGDLVLVPAGKDNNEAVVEVVDIEYFNEETAPMPIDKIKYVIRKSEDDDFANSDMEREGE